MTGSKKSPRKAAALSSSTHRVATRASAASNASTTVIAVEDNDEHTLEPQPHPNYGAASRSASTALPHPTTSEDDTDAPPPPIKTHSRPTIAIAPAVQSYHNHHPHLQQHAPYPHPHPYGPLSYGPPPPPPPSHYDVRYTGDPYVYHPHPQHPSGYGVSAPTLGQEYAYHHPPPSLTHQYAAYDERPPAAYYPLPPVAVPSQYPHHPPPPLPPPNYQSTQDSPPQQRPPRRSSRSGSHRRATQHPHQAYPLPPGEPYQNSPSERHLPSPHVQYAAPPQQYHHHPPPPAYHPDLRLPPITPPPSAAGPYAYTLTHPYAHYQAQEHVPCPEDGNQDHGEGEDDDDQAGGDDSSSRSTITESSGHRRKAKTPGVEDGANSAEGEEHGNLDSLADGPEGPGSRPPYPYSTIIKYAIEGSPRRMLTLSEIYEAVEGRFPFFALQAEGQGWKNSIRHNLSLNRLFVKRPRAITEPGKGAYWMIAHGEKAGPKRVRKRKPRGKKAQAEAKAKAEADAAAAAAAAELADADADMVMTARNGKAHRNGRHTQCSRTTPLSRDAPEEYDDRDDGDVGGGGDGGRSRPPTKKWRTNEPGILPSYQHNQRYTDDQQQGPPQRSPRTRYPPHLQRGSGNHHRDPFHRVVSIDGDPLMFEPPAAARELRHHHHDQQIHRKGTLTPVRYQPYDRSGRGRGRGGSISTVSEHGGGDGADDAGDCTPSQLSVHAHERSLSGQSWQSATTATARSSRR